MPVMSTTYVIRLLNGCHHHEVGYILIYTFKPWSLSRMLAKRNVLYAHFFPRPSCGVVRSFNMQVAIDQLT